MVRGRVALWAVSTLLLSACSSSQAGQRPEGNADATAPKRVQLERVDLLVVMENSTGIDVEQCALQAQLRRLLEGLAAGERSDGRRFPPALDIHVAIVSTDLGDGGRGDALGLAEIGCRGIGDDGLLNSRGLRECHNEAGTFVFDTGVDTCCADAMQCAESYPPFLAFSDTAAVGRAAADLACIANPGASGCMFEQPFEAALKALWPGRDDAITFAGGSRGHGDGANAGFLRAAPSERSLLVILVLGDEDDCSAADTGFFSALTAASDPDEGVNSTARCARNEAALHPIARYIEGFRALQAGYEDLVFFAAITGIPVDRVDDAATAEVDFGDATQREAFYDGILSDDRMQKVVESGRLRPACQASIAFREAQPARRVVELARRFGSNAALRSVCETDPDTGALDYARAVDHILDRIAERLEADGA